MNRARWTVGLVAPMVTACQVLLVLDAPGANALDAPGANTADAPGASTSDGAGANDGGLVSEARAADSSADGTPGPVPRSCPPPGDVIGCDTFDRADQANGWGQATSGQFWEVAPPSTTYFSVSSRTAKLEAPQQWQVARLGGNDTDVEVFVVFSVSGPDARVGAILRENSNAYYAAVFQNAGPTLSIQTFANGVPTSSGGGVTVPGGSNPGATGVYALRFRAKGALLEAKAWRNEDLEPAAWMTSVPASLSDVAAGRSGMVAVNGQLLVAYFKATHAP